MTASAVSHDVPGLKPQITLDLNGLTSPGPLPRLRRALQTLENGQLLLLISDYPGVEYDLFVWAKQTNNQLLHVDRARPKGFGFYLLKGDPVPVACTVDMTGFPCPTPVLAVNKHIDPLRAGQNIKLLCDCPAAPTEVNTWIKTNGHKLLSMTEDVRGVYRFYIKK